MTFVEILEDGLRFRTIQNEVDIARYVAFNTEYNNVHEGKNSDLLIRHFPGAQFGDFQLIEDEQTGEIVSTTCLIPWQFSYDGILLRGAQLEQVLSHPDYRRRGLVKRQINRFMQVVREKQFDFSFIWGIPYYYRQYGYAYCLEGNRSEHLPAEKIPVDASAAASQYTFRLAGIEDAAVLTRLYHQALQPVKIYITRDEGYWRYLLEWARFPVYLLIEQQTGREAGYLGLAQPTGGKHTAILESSLPGAGASLAALGWLKAQGAQEIHVSWPKESPLVQLAKSLGSRETSHEQWLVQITDPVEFFTKIGPVFKRRLQAAGRPGLTQDLVINLFRQAYKLRFQEGSLQDVCALGFVDSSMGADGGDLCIPPEAFVRLVFGFRRIDELLDAWPDIVYKPQVRGLLDDLFPRMTSYLQANYQCYAS